jgi:hypothetical protein
MGIEWVTGFIGGLVIFYGSSVGPSQMLGA